MFFDRSFHTLQGKSEGEILAKIWKHNWKLSDLVHLLDKIYPKKYVSHSSSETEKFWKKNT